MLSFIFGFAVGAVIIGVVANRRPQWFAKIVRGANAVDDSVNIAADRLKGK